MESIKLSSTIRPAHRHELIGNPCVFLHDHRQTAFHSHRQPSALVIAMNASPLLDLVIFCCFPIGTNPHQQLSYRLVAIFPPADLHHINSGAYPKIRVQKRCQQAASLFRPRQKW